MSADSGKPDAAEWAGKWDYSWPYWTPEKHAKNVALLADFQRETLHWAAREIGHGPRCQHGCVVAELERLAESCGRGK